MITQCAPPPPVTVRPGCDISRVKLLGRKPCICSPSYKLHLICCLHVIVSWTSVLLVIGWVCVCVGGVPWCYDTADVARAPAQMGLSNARQTLQPLVSCKPFY